MPFPDDAARDAASFAIEQLRAAQADILSAIMHLAAAEGCCDEAKDLDSGLSDTVSDIQGVIDKLTVAIEEYDEPQHVQDVRDRNWHMQKVL